MNANTKRICNPAGDGGLKGIIVFEFDVWNCIRYYEEFHWIWEISLDRRNFIG